MISIPVSTGELIDKLSILSVKKNKVTNPIKLENINREYDLLYDISLEFFKNYKIYLLYVELLCINTFLWDVEDSLRKLELENNFENEFIDFARKVYYYNDERFDLKQKINAITSSEIVEVKEYVKYKV